MISVNNKKVKIIKRMTTRRLNRLIFGHCVRIKSNWQKPFEGIFSNTTHRFKKQLKMSEVKCRDGYLIHPNECNKVLVYSNFSMGENFEQQVLRLFENLQNQINTNFTTSQNQMNANFTNLQNQINANFTNFQLQLQQQINHHFININHQLDELDNDIININATLTDIVPKVDTLYALYMAQQQPQQNAAAAVQNAVPNAHPNANGPEALNGGNNDENGSSDEN